MSDTIKIESISKSFKKHKVLNDINFSIEKGEIFGLIGLNGVGKTTLIKIMLGLLKADNGNIKLFEENAYSKKSRSNLCFIPEKFQPSHLLKGHEFLKLSQSYYGKKYNHKKAEKIAEELSLRPEALKNKITSYSKGMGQKLGLISAFLSDCPLLILDEPMSGLDPNARIALKNTLISYAKQGKTIFFSSHILSDIDEICTSIGAISNSELIYHGSPDNFKKEYKEKNLERCFLKAIGNKV